MSFFGLLKAAPKAVDDVLDKDNGLLTQIGGWIGGQQFTDEEKAEMNEGMRKGVVKYAVDTMSENSQRSRARREVAIMWIKVQLWLIMFCAITIPFNKEMSTSYFNLATSSVMIGGTAAIITFFFGSYMLSRHNETKGGK